MATTGFWPVKNRLKEVIDYAENPDKTTNKKYLDDDLYKALMYAENEKKTDEKMYVTAINCPTKKAYTYMMNTKKRFGKTGGNVAYHGYQSFKAGEVTPDEAHKIGLLTARRMWGKEYEIVVTTHLNTDNIHNHIVVNSVSFRTGKKFQNHISDHYKLREISDEVCREFGKSMLPQKNFNGESNKNYWAKQKGNITHRDLLYRDVTEILKTCTNLEKFKNQLESMGYKILRDGNYKCITVIVPNWKRGVRLESIGYSNEKITSCLKDNLKKQQFSYTYFKYTFPKTYPLLNFEKQLNYEIAHSNDTAKILVDVVFLIILQLINLVRDVDYIKNPDRPRIPAFRQIVSQEKRLKEEYFLLKNNDIHTEKDILDFIDRCTDEISVLEKERQKIRNSNRRPKSEEERQMKNAASREITKKIKPIRKNLKLAESVINQYPKLYKILETEYVAEKTAFIKKRGRER